MVWGAVCRYMGVADERRCASDPSFDVAAVGCGVGRCSGRGEKEEGLVAVDSWMNGQD